MSAIYDTIGVNYADLRQPDARIADVIHQALGDARTIVNVGAGAGSYEPTDRDVTAVEPSMEMISQRPADAAPVKQAGAESLPFDDNSFDACMAVLTVHHWSDKAKGMAEMRRVTRGPIVILTFDPAYTDFWLTDYLPQLIAIDDGQMPVMTDYAKWLGPDVKIASVPVPHDCTDGFLGAYWRRPTAYLDPRIRAAISSFWKIGDITAELARLEADITSGAWTEKYGHLNDRDSFDLGYRLVTA